MITDSDIRQLMKEMLNVEYVGRIDVTLEDGFYTAHLYMNNSTRPRLSISIETEDDEVFWKHLVEELRTRHLEEVKSWRLNKYPNPHE